MIYDVEVYKAIIELYRCVNTFNTIDKLIDGAPMVESKSIVPDINVPELNVYDLHSPDELEISEAKFFTSNLWYEEYIKSAKHDALHEWLINMWSYYCPFKYMLKLARDTFGSKVSMFIHATRIIEVCRARGAKLHMLYKPSAVRTVCINGNICDITCDWVEALHSEMFNPGSKPELLQFAVELYTGMYYAVRPRGFFGKHNFTKDLKAINIRWYDGKLLFIRESNVWAEDPIVTCLAKRHW